MTMIEMVIVIVSFAALIYWLCMGTNKAGEPDA